MFSVALISSSCAKYTSSSLFILEVLLGLKLFFSSLSQSDTVWPALHFFPIGEQMGQWEGENGMSPSSPSLLGCSFGTWLSKAGGVGFGSQPQVVYLIQAGDSLLLKNPGLPLLHYRSHFSPAFVFLLIVFWSTIAGEGVAMSLS